MQVPLHKAFSFSRILFQYNFLFIHSVVLFIYISMLSMPYHLTHALLHELINKTYIASYVRRHYGALQGLDKQETVEKYGKDQVNVWRRYVPSCVFTQQHYNRFL
jgi:bisphosphoglycerate-dependent phosphoglycerate mutase